MLRRSILPALGALLVVLAMSSKAQAWGCYHVGYTHYSPYTGLHHYGYTEASRGYGGYGGGGYHYGGYHYSGYHYGGYGGYGGYHYGYYRRY